MGCCSSKEAALAEEARLEAQAQEQATAAAIAKDIEIKQAVAIALEAAGEAAAAKAEAAAAEAEARDPYRDGGPLSQRGNRTGPINNIFELLSLEKGLREFSPAEPAIQFRIAIQGDPVYLRVNVNNDNTVSGPDVPGYIPSPKGAGPAQPPPPPGSIGPALLRGPAGAGVGTAGGGGGGGGLGPGGLSGIPGTISYNADGSVWVQNRAADGYGASADDGAGGRPGVINPLRPNERCVRVVTAVRPLLPHERSCTDIVEIFPPGRIELPKKIKGGTGGASAVERYPFDFDHVIRVDDARASSEMYATLGLPVVERFCQGFNATVLAYGQTGSGKTYTMGTACTMEEFLCAEPRGVVPRTLMILFSYIAVVSRMYDVTLKVQYVEIYNDGVLDLLSSEAPSKAAAARLDIRERPDGEVFVEGACEITVASREEIAGVLDQGNAKRSVASHKMNSESSRSHAIVSLMLEQRAKVSTAMDIPEDLRFLRSKLNLVDLAGSERQRDTGAQGDRFSEGVNINQGLLQLGNVINALTEGKSRTHVPYRNSKLTRLLQDSLGGNSETLFVACVSPADKNHEQTLNTLRYASRARAIRNNVVMNNKMGAEEEIEYLRALVKQLQGEKVDLKGQLVATLEQLEVLQDAAAAAAPGGTYAQAVAGAKIVAVR